MKKLKVLGVAGVLSLAMGTSVFAADFSGGVRMIRGHMNPSVCAARNYVRPLAGMTAARCNLENCNFICGNLGEYCRNYVEAANLAVNDSYADVAVSESYTDAAIYGSYSESADVYDDYSTDYGYGGNYVDADNDGVCDNWQNGGYGGGNGNGYCGGYGNGGGYGGGHHGGGHGRGCNW